MDRINRIDKNRRIEILSVLLLITVVRDAKLCFSSEVNLCVKDSLLWWWPFRSHPR